METAKEFMTMVAMVKLVAFISALFRLLTVIVSEAASTRKMKIVNVLNHLISILGIKVKQIYACPSTTKQSIL